MCKCKYDMLQMTKFMCHKLWGKETIVKRSIFSFSNNVVKRLISQGRKSRGRVEKSEGLICLLYMTPF